MRVGSRWLHYLLADLLGKGVSGELDVSRIPECQKLVESYFRQNKIVKFHHAKPEDIFKLKGNFTTIAVVRNPRDRIVSYAFHQRYKPLGEGLAEIKNAPNDEEAVRETLYHPIIKQHDKDQFSLMLRAGSTKKFNPDYIRSYIWTSYHWLKQDLVGEITTIVKFLGAKISPFEIRTVCRKHEFDSRSGREPGNERRLNQWFRKGVENDFMLWFDEQMLYDSHDDAFKYWKIIKGEESKELNKKEFTI